MICGVLCLDDQDGLMIAAMFLNLLKAGLVCSGRLVPCVPTAVAGSKTGISIRDCQSCSESVFDVWRENSGLESDPGTIGLV